MDQMAPALSDYNRCGEDRMPRQSRAKGISSLPSFTSPPIANFLQAGDHTLLDLLKSKGRGRTVYDRVLVVSLDSEYFKHGGRNTPLSYQGVSASLKGVSTFIHYTPTAERLKRGLSIEGHLTSDARAITERLRLEEIIELAMVANDGGALGNYKSGRTRVILVAHHTPAEISMMADRDHASITKNLTSIRKSPVTGHPIKLCNSKIGKADVEILDTKLLAPAGLQSLAALSSLLSREEEKLEIPEHYRANMDQLLRDDPVLFERYAMRDAEVTAKLFFLLQRELNELAFGAIERPFKTLASAAIKGFLRWNEWFKEYQMALTQGGFAAAVPIVKRGYLGGLNMGCLRGDTNAYAPTRDYIYVDIDFANAYANGMARCPKIDLSGTVEIVRADYKWDASTESALLTENIPPDLIARASDAVAQGPGAVEALLHELRSVRGRDREEKNRGLHLRPACRRRTHAKILRDILLVPDNRLLDRWIEQSGEIGRGWEIPGFAKVRFSFPEDAQFPCLPVRTPPYGLIYPLSGETTVPAVELVLAVKAGAKVEVLWGCEYPVAVDATGRANLYFYDHLKYLVGLRAEAKALAGVSSEAAAREQLLKEMINAFYGKSAQGLNFRCMSNLATGELFPLSPSEITEPTVAALTTAQVRAALASTMLAVESYNSSRPGERPIVVISATTDGLLIGLPCQPGYSVSEEYYTPPSPDDRGRGKPPRMKKINIGALLEKFGHRGLLDAFYQYAPIRNLREMRKALTGQDDFLEVKHLADWIVSVKTRGQIGMVTYEGGNFCSLIARCGHRVPLRLLFDDPEVYSRIVKGDRNTADALWLFERIDKALAEESIELYPFENLTSYKSIIESEGELDLVNRVSMKKVNCDWDFKRQFERDTAGDLLPTTRPYPDIPAMLRARRQADVIRKGGENATPELVAKRLKLKGRGLRARSGRAALLTGVFLRGLVQGHFGVTPARTETEIAHIVDRIWLELGVTPAKQWSRSDVSYARRAEWQLNALIHSPTHDRLLGKLCEVFVVDRDQVKQLLFATDVAERDTRPLVVAVVTSILYGPRLGIEPFAALHSAGALPGRNALLERFRYELGDTGIGAANSFPVSIPSTDRVRLRRLLVLAGLSGDEARRCAETLAPLQAGEHKERRNPLVKVCLERFVTALHQPDINAGSFRSGEVMQQLKPFGLSKRSFYTARGKTLVARSLKSTNENRRQIEAMAAALKLDATRFLDALLESS